MTVPEQPPSGLPELTDEQKRSLAEEYLKGATHDQLKTIPAYNQGYQKIILAAHEEANKTREELAAERQQSAQLDQWETYLYRQLAPEQRNQLLQQDPRAAAANAAVIQRRNPAPDNAEAVYPATVNMMETFESDLKADPAYENFDWNAWKRESSPAKAMRMLTEHGVKSLTPGREVMQEEVRAAVNEALAQQGIRRVQPDILPAPLGGGNALMSYDQLMAMDPGARQEWREKNPQEYDSVTSQYIAGREQRGLQRLDQVGRR